MAVNAFLWCGIWTAMADSEYLKYKDPNLPVAIRVKDLLGRMTLDEKIGQMTQIDREVASFYVMKNFSIGNFFVFTNYDLLLLLLCLISITRAML